MWEVEEYDLQTCCSLAGGCHRWDMEDMEADSDCLGMPRNVRPACMEKHAEVEYDAEAVVPDQRSTVAHQIDEKRLTRERLGQLQLSSDQSSESPHQEQLGSVEVRLVCVAHRLDACEHRLRRCCHHEEVDNALVERYLLVEDSAPAVRDSGQSGLGAYSPVDERQRRGHADPAVAVEEAARTPRRAVLRRVPGRVHIQREQARMLESGQKLE